MIICKKVSFATEKFALQYVEKLKATSCRKRNPVNAYLCEKCLTWHLTSIDTMENRQNVQLKRQIENLKSKVAHFEKQYELLKSKFDKTTLNK